MADGEVVVAAEPTLPTTLVAGKNEGAAVHLRPSMKFKHDRLRLNRSCSAYICLRGQFTFEFGSTWNDRAPVSRFRRSAPMVTAGHGTLAFVLSGLLISEVHGKCTNFGGRTLEDRQHIQETCAPGPGHRSAISRRDGDDGPSQQLGQAAWVGQPHGSEPSCRRPRAPGCGSGRRSHRFHGTGSLPPPGWDGRHRW
jgi:hypothetical protein